MTTTTEHRGLDIGTATGVVHLSGGLKELSTLKTVDSWANDIATLDNDIIQLRKKNGIIYVMKVEPHTAGKWEKLDPTATPVVTDPHGAKLEEVTLAMLRDQLVAAEEETKLIPQMNIGWYQDQKADLYYYEGEGHWREVDLKTNKMLTDFVVSGTLEYIS